MQRISVNLTNDCSGNELHHNNISPAVGNKNYAIQKPFERDFLSQLLTTRNCERHFLFVEWPKAPDFAHIFLLKIIRNNYFIVEIIEIYFVIFT